MDSEVIMVQDEGVPVWVTYTELRLPGRYYSWKRTWYSGALALTRERFIAFGYGKKLVDVRLDDPRFKQIEWSTGRADELWASFGASLFHLDWSGRIEISFSTPLTPLFLARLSRYSQTGFL
ncbi:MAG: hypothetical protein B6D39_00235 [Anaerolineae bacterium UTCFX2]|nr:MAG: hypothetical protein B6D39_00235 [Anaerolineae bacterium UTCFX2]